MYFTVGLLLILLGLGSYVVSGAVSLTALIPAFFGVPLLACGLWQRRTSGERRVHVAVAAFSVLGLLAVAPRFLSSLPRWAEGLSLALVAQALLFLSLLVALRASLRELVARRDDG